MNYSSEWQDSLNPFNSMKVFYWREWLEGCAVENYLPPITIALDPTTECNLNCIWCNSFDIRRERFTMSDTHGEKIVDFLKTWGVKSICIAGGGEPTLAPSFDAILKKAGEHKISCATVTNGVELSKERIEMIARTCDWIGVSIDAGSSDTYCMVKGIFGASLFHQVITNIQSLKAKIIDIKSKCRIGFKFLIHPSNQHEILKAGILAREIGADDVQFRPVGWDNLTITKGKEKLEYNLPRINAEIEEVLKLTTEDFKVYVVRHKFNPDFSLKRDFKHCLASPMNGVFGADGNFYICVDRRGDKSLLLCRHYPDPGIVKESWGSKKHIDMIREVNIYDCPRCTCGAYNEIIEKCIIKNTMCKEYL